MRYLLVSTILILSSLAGGCANYYVIPESLDQKIDRTVTFADLKQNPEKYKGKTVALGGLVLRAKHLKEGTQIEVLQIPLSRSDRPDYTTEASEGRFLLLDPEHHDPAVLQNHRITVVGEVIGQRVQTIDEFEYAFPYVSARFIFIWSQPARYYPYPYTPPYYYYPDPYWYQPYWYYPYPPPVVITPPPSPPPERRFDSPDSGSSPPGGKKRRFE